VPSERQTPPDPPDDFANRHIGPTGEDTAQMLAELGFGSLAELVDAAVPGDIRLGRPLQLGPPRDEQQAILELRRLAAKNRRCRSWLGQGYYSALTPPVIWRNVVENPGFYTQYTPYQAEISQGRLEALLNFQTLIADLTGMALANASLLDEATAAAEAMTMCRTITRGRRRGFFVEHGCHPQTQAVVRTRARPLGIQLHGGSAHEIDFAAQDLFGVLLQYPTTDGRIEDYTALCRRAHEAGALVVTATDLLALALLRPPGEFGSDIAVGSSQRFGVPLGYGGPHAAFLATRDEFKRQIPGRIVGISRDSADQRAYRLALQTREQHIRRDRATSNICTAQVLPAIVASMYAVYHGPTGLRRIAARVHRQTAALAAGLRRLGYDVGPHPCFDTLRVRTGEAEATKILGAAAAQGVNLRKYPDWHLGVSLDETAGAEDVTTLLRLFAPAGAPELDAADVLGQAAGDYPAGLKRASGYLKHPVFNSYHSEHELMRYLHRLQARDLSLTTSMIPLGSCTMKLSPTTAMLPLSWPEFADLHPFAPADQAEGYERLARQLAGWLAEITGLPGVSLQPNSGAQGEYAGLLVIRAYHEQRGESQRNACLIPTSAHGTNPASATMAGFEVVAVACDADGSVDLADLRAKAAAHRDRVAALMLTYPSTHGVFENTVREICSVIHEHGGQVYLDGANLNAQVGLCRPGDYGADVCHLNLHKTFAIPHGGGGPGVGPIAVAEHLVPFLPGHPARPAGPLAIGPVAATPLGSASILPISWTYMALLGAAGLRRASQVAILNANYLKQRLSAHYPVLFTGNRGLVAHEFVIDARAFKKTAGVEVDDIAKRLMDFGFHAPTMSWPVPGTLMVEPTESESRAELDRFCDSLIAIREEIRAIETGAADPRDNPLKHAPHTSLAVSADEWSHPYSRQQAAFPAPHTQEHKYWPPVGRIDNARGDRQLVCSRNDEQSG
jgi:glycine dehydrogenase